MTVSSVGTSGRTYSTWQAWEDAALAVLVAPWEGEGYNDSEFSVAGTVLTVAGITTSSSNFIEARPASGQGFAANAGAATLPLKYDQSKGVGLKCTADYGVAIDIQVDFVRLRGLQTTRTGAGDSFGVVVMNSTALTGCLVRDNIVELGPSASNGAYNGIVFIKSGALENVVAIDNSGTGNGIMFDYAGTVSATNCTVVRPSDKSAARFSFRKESSGTATIANCAGFGFSGFSTGSGYSGSNNASDQTIGFGTSNQASQTYANQFQNVVAATQDWRPKSGGALISNATSSGAPSNDIIGQPFTNTIGARQAGSAPSSTFPLGFFEVTPGMKPPVHLGY